MPVVPFGNPKAPQRPPVDPVFEAIAAADLHEAGLLFEPKPTEPPAEESSE